MISIFSGKMLEGESPTIFGDGNQTRDYVFVDDVVHAFALAQDRGSGKLINIGTGLETSVNGLYRMLAEVTGFTGQPLYGQLPEGELRRNALDIGVAIALRKEQFAILYHRDDSSRDIFPGQLQRHQSIEKGLQIALREFVPTRWNAFGARRGALGLRSEGICFWLLRQ